MGNRTRKREREREKRRENGQKDERESKVTTTSCRLKRPPKVEKLAHVCEGGGFQGTPP
jgi:hypothetical protein